MGLVANSQVLRPSTAPITNSTGRIEYGYLQADSGYIWSTARDTFPARYKTTIWHTDGNFYKTLGGVGSYWTLWIPKVAATVSEVNTNASTGITGGPITTTGTISADTSILTTRARTRQQTDSVIGLISAGGFGTVLSVSVVNSNGITGTVVNPTSTPAITLKLFDITPTSVNSSGAITATTLAAINSITGGSLSVSGSATILGNGYVAGNLGVAGPTALSSFLTVGSSIAQGAFSSALAKTDNSGTFVAAVPGTDFGTVALANPPLFLTLSNTTVNADTGRGNTQLATGYDLNRVKDSLGAFQYWQKPYKTISPVETYDSLRLYNTFEGTSEVLHGGLVVGDSVTAQVDSVFAYGDSNTIAVCCAQVFKYVTEFSNKIKSFPNNLGISGETLTQVTPGDNSFITRLSTVPNYRSTIRYLTMMFGTNDCDFSVPLASFATALSNSLDTLILSRGYPLNRIVVMSPPLLGFNAIYQKTRDSVLRFVNVCDSIARLKGVKYFDTYHYMINNGDASLVGSDSVHITSLGQYVMGRGLTYSISGSVLVENSLTVNRGDVKVNNGNLTVTGAGVITAGLSVTGSILTNTLSVTANATVGTFSSFGTAMIGGNMSIGNNISAPGATIGITERNINSLSGNFSSMVATTVISNSTTATGSATGYRVNDFIASTNTGSYTNASTLTSFASAPTIQSGATGALQGSVGYAYSFTNAGGMNVGLVKGLTINAIINSGGGGISSITGINVSSLTAGSNNTSILLGTLTQRNGNWGIDNQSGYNNYHGSAANLFGTTTIPSNTNEKITVAGKTKTDSLETSVLNVTSNATIGGNLTVTGDLKINAQAGTAGVDSILVSHNGVVMAISAAYYGAGGGGVTGSGTANLLTKWTATSVIGTSILADNGTTLQSGAAPSLGSRMELGAPTGSAVATLILTQTSASNQYSFRSLDNNTGQFTSNLTASGTFTSTGNISITGIVSGAGVTTTGGATIGSLAGTGSRAVLADATGVLSAPVSDSSVKDKIRPIKYGIETIMKLTPVWGEYKKGWKNYGEGRQNFLIAQNVQKYIPEAVFLTPQTGKLGINKDQLDAVYVQALQDLQHEINELRLEIKKLKKRK